MGKAVKAVVCPTCNTLYQDTACATSFVVGQNITMRCSHCGTAFDLVLKKRTWPLSPEITINRRG